MAKDEAPINFESYAYGALAKRLLKNKESGLALSALELLAGEDGANLGENEVDAIQRSYVSLDKLETAIDIYGSMFEDRRENSIVNSGIVNWYTPILEDASDAQKDIIAKTFNHKISLGKLRKQVNEAKFVLSADEGHYGDEDENRRTVAKATIKKFGKVQKMIGELDSHMFEHYRAKAANKAREEWLEGIETVA